MFEKRLVILDTFEMPPSSAAGSNHINLYMFRSCGTPIFLYHHCTGLKPGATICIAPLELICAALLYFVRDL